MTKEAKNTRLPALGNRFLINHEFKDFYSDTQRTMKRIGDIGPESEKYKQAAYHQFAGKQEDYVAPEMYGTPGREGNKNFNRMEYDNVERLDGKEHSKVLKNVLKTKAIDVKDLLKAIKPKDDTYTVQTTDTIVSDRPITRDK